MGCVFARLHSSYQVGQSAILFVGVSPHLATLLEPFRLPKTNQFDKHCAICSRAVPRRQGDGRERTRAELRLLTLNPAMNNMQSCSQEARNQGIESGTQLKYLSLPKGVLQLPFQATFGDHIIHSCILLFTYLLLKQGRNFDP